MFTSIWLNKDIPAYDEGAPNRGPLRVPMVEQILLYCIALVGLRRLLIFAVLLVQLSCFKCVLSFGHDL